ncbi:NUDIX domain-containing protein [Jeotgalibacillus sp. R-1-5s-1]|uniref:NUDIX domain-containing protein n=1 Tax=Jeotgalibacillus sp. R-1-5s-1 TaxID=2555897 RepID=UPI00106D28E4|nr:NUDIX domain-containing protein [Jeotgalibacillus sp. R-1-5s-1]TFD93589.1 NUDIX domain-containing protein [Jeotgalibacillus sp. R-1-5s-1]
MFRKYYGQDHLPDLPKKKIRTAVRAIIFKGDQIMVERSNVNDVKLPGGGVENGETHKQALIREIKEETGYTCRHVGEKVGEVIEHQRDLFEKDTLFEMISHYYICEIDASDQSDLKLDAYEEELDFTPVWMTLEEAIALNKAADENGTGNGWIRRENDVFELLGDGAGVPFR